LGKEPETIASLFPSPILTCIPVYQFFIFPLDKETGAGYYGSPNKFGRKDHFESDGLFRLYSELAFLLLLLDSGLPIA
jgi:hypothetical protein